MNIYDIVDTGYWFDSNRVIDLIDWDFAKRRYGVTLKDKENVSSDYGDAYIEKGSLIVYLDNTYIENIESGWYSMTINFDEYGDPIFSYSIDSIVSKED